MVQRKKSDTLSNWARDLDKPEDSWAGQLDTVVQDDGWASALDAKPETIVPEDPRAFDKLQSELQRESVGEVVEEFPTAISLSPAAGTIGLKSVLGRDTGEFDATQMAPILSEESKANFVDNMSQLFSLVKNPYDVIKGTAELITQIPGFMLSVIPAMRSTFEKQGSHDTLLDLQESFWEELEGPMGWWHENITGPVGRVFDTPRKVRDRLRKSLLGVEPEARRGDESEMVGEIFMAPLTAATGSIHAIADDPFFDDSPNWKGAIKIVGDVIGFAFMGMFYKGGRAALARDLDPLVKKGVELKEKQTKIDAIPDEGVKEVAQKILDAEKVQVELEAAEVMKRQDFDKLIKEDLSSKTTQIEKIKQPQREIVDVQIDKALREKDRSKIEPTVKEPTTDLDLQTGTREPIELSTEKSPFREKPERTNFLLEELGPLEKLDDPYTILTRLTSEVNAWLDGSNAFDIVQARNFLSEIAVAAKSQGAGKSRVGEAFEGMSLEEITNFGKLASEAAVWARRADRPKIEQPLEPEVVYGKILERPDAVKEYDVWLAEFKKTEGDRILQKAEESRAEVERRLGPLADKKIAFIHHIRKTYNKTLEEAKAIADGLYSGKLTVDDVRARLAKPIGQPGTELYSGLDPKEALKLIKESAKYGKEFLDEFTKSMRAKDFDLTYAMKKLKVDTVQLALEQSETLMKHVLKKYDVAGARVVQRQRAAASSTGYGTVVYEQLNKEVFRGKSPRMVDATNAYILAERFKDIYGYKAESAYKHRKGYGSKQAVGVDHAIDEYYKLTPKESVEVRRSGETFFEHIRRAIDDAVEAEVKSFEEGELLKAHDFRKFKTLTIESLFDNVRKTKLGNRTIKSTDSGIESLGHGSTKILEPDARVSTQEMMGRLYGSAGNNIAKLAWRDLADKYSDNPIVSTESVHKWSPIPYFDKGKRKNLYFHPDAAKHLITQSHDMSRRLTKVAQWLFLAPVTRSLAVGTSPAWGTLVGFPMDVMHSLFTAKTFDVAKGKKRPVYGPFTPAYPFKLGADLARTFHDTFHRGPLFKDYAKYGGMMPFLSQRQGRYMKGTKPPGQFAKLIDILTYHGASMELWARHAIADRVIRNRAKEQGKTYEQARKDKDIMYEAVHAARDRMDYNQGGWGIKAADQGGLIFLNAGVLGARKFWASAIENPVDFTLKTAQVGIAATGIAATAWMLYPEVVKEIPKRGNERNVTFPLFPNWISFTDRNGNIRHLYAKLRMDPGAAFFYKLFNTLTQTYLYDRGLIKEEPDYKDVIRTLREQLPTDLQLPPHMQMWVDYGTNYSWWKDRMMYKEAGGRTYAWPKSMHEGIYEKGLRDPRISQLAADVGKVTKLSPKRLQESIGNVFPQGNEWVYLFGKAYEVGFDDLPKELRKEHFLMTLARMPGFSKVIGVTVPELDRRKIRDEDAEVDLIKETTRNGTLDQMAKAYYWSGYGSYKTIAGYLAEQKDIDVFESMEKRANFIRDSKTLGHRDFWLGMYHYSPEAKARDWVKTYSRVGKEEKRELLLERAQLEVLGGYITDKFLEEEAKLAQFGPTPKVQVD